MNGTAAQPETVLEAIERWSNTRPLWLRDALRRVVQQQSITDADLDELVTLCLEENGQKTEGKEALKPAPLRREELPASPTAANSITLVSIAGVEFTNQLAPNQTLSVGEAGLTIVYGDNASGKSGYARLLKRSCRARNRGVEIEPNIYGTGVPKKASAKLNYKAGSTPKSVPWTDGPNSSVLELSAVSVFDADCAAVHVEGKNDVAFRPHGLDVPERLASVCQRLRVSLEALRKAAQLDRDPVFQLPTWSPTTTVGKTLSGLRHDTNYENLAKLTPLSGEEKKRLKQLREDLSKDPAAAAKELRLRVGRFKGLATYVNDVEDQISDATLSELARLVADSRKKREVAHTAAEKLFASGPVAGVGGETWRELWESARRYSEQAAYPKRAFPVTENDARCVLCQQPLSPEAADKFQKLEDFVKADTERQARDAQARAKTAWEALKKAKVRTGPCREGLRELAHHEAALAADVRRFVIVAGLRKRSVLRAINAKQEPAPPTSADSPVKGLREYIDKETERAANLEKASADSVRTKLKAECGELNDRELLEPLLPKVKKEIARLKTVHILDKCLAATNTKPITELGNALAEQVLTPQLRDRFAEELISLAGSRVRAELTYAGGKTGTPQYQVRLIAKPTADVAQVLSEGEATCVALAGFLTELATADHRSTLVFDDPVCSLDHKWRLKVAKRLVREAGTRQVLVFTHDIVFVHDLHDQANEQAVPCELRNLRRDSSGTGVVGDGLPWIGMRIEHRLDELGKRGRAAKAFFEANQEDQYNREVEDIYADLRATWERALEEVAFQRTVIRHRDYIDTKELKKVSVITATDCEDFRKHFLKCSDVVKSHDRSPGRNPEHPEPVELLADIQALDDWVKSLRQRHKAV